LRAAIELGCTAIVRRSAIDGPRVGAGRAGVRAGNAGEWPAEAVNAVRAVSAPTCTPFGFPRTRHIRGRRIALGELLGRELDAHDRARKLAAPLIHLCHLTRSQVLSHALANRGRAAARRYAVVLRSV
jgi:hypothetical protein